MKLHLFFKSRDYRKMCLFRIIDWIKTPFIYIKAVCKAIKLNIDYPNNWDKYVKIKDIEHHTELGQKEKAKAIAYCNFIGAISRFDICIFSCGDEITRADQTNLQEEFDETKQEIQNCVKELEEMDVVIPDELKTIVESTNWDSDSFTNLEECKKFSDNLHVICDKINLT